eukprot:CAMPEP_0194364898 /NCGR_PEP_ID=MMETSP0174-20130528/12850_1 /TAXON_ID=216777 /ORGANISM="Proboscia alata, Strain PI-D3" /LENGTH=439 /DNA_ID=CAMNT_0039139215 /DNA_START=81 /DNA_END=1400 /DNA_ORIENTATION=-
MKVSPFLSIAALVFSSEILASHVEDLDVEEPPRRQLRNSYMVDPRSIILKGNHGDQTWANTRALGGGLRHDWTNLRDPKKMSTHANVIDFYQNPKDACERPVRHDLNIFRVEMPNSGLGSSFHLWARYLCHAYDRKAVLVVEPNEHILGQTPTGFLWNDSRYCGSHDSPLSCYFGPHESLRACDFSKSEKADLLKDVPIHKFSFSDPIVGGDSVQGCTFIDKNRENTANFPHEVPPGVSMREHNAHIVDEYKSTISFWYAAAMEFLFQKVNPIVISAAHRQLLAMFDRGIVPANMVTVHIRWGDKAKEMTLVGIEEYIKATKQIIGEGWDTKPQHIYVASEDDRAISDFSINMPKNWKVYSSGPTVKKPENGPSNQAELNEGQDGLEALAALLVSLEANKYVLTTQSNWSRLINELRKGIIHQRCGECTTMIDVSPGEA